MKNPDIPFVVAAITLVLGIFASWSSNAAPESATIPAPPEQSTPWTPPQTTLPQIAVSAIAELFKEGTADPRGCEYREINLPNTTIHGWVLPGGRENGNGFAVAWNGLIYHVTNIGPPADLETDVKAKLAWDSKLPTVDGVPYTGPRYNKPLDEWSAIETNSFDLLDVAMLLRLGRADLAETIWNQWFSRSPGGDKDPYLLLVQERATSMYGHALSGYANGEDADSLASCRALLKFQAMVEATAPARGFPRHPPGTSYIGKYPELPRLTADEKRRTQEQPHAPVLASRAPEQGPERIAALIQDLELISARQEMIPGSTDVSTDPIVQALIKEGDPAVEPLLKCLEEDPRMTRSVYTQGMFQGGALIPVYEPAFDAIVGILKMPFAITDGNADPRHLSLDERKALVAKIRTYWQPLKGMTPSERWYATLEDDNAAPGEWFQALDNIVQPTDDFRAPVTAFGGGWGGFRTYPPPTHIVLQGEPLRSKTNPSVSELIIKRFDQLFAQAASDRTASADPLGKLVIALADWDGKARLADIRAMGRAIEKRFPEGGVDYRFGTPGAPMQTAVDILQKRIHLGDPQALQDYVDWLAPVKPDDLYGFPSTLPFQIMWEHPGEPIIQRAAEKMFGVKTSPWGNVELDSLLVTPLVGLAGFREAIDRGLADTSVIGHVEVFDNGRAAIGRDNSPNSQEPNLHSMFDPLLPPAGSKVSFRMCDYYAYRLSAMDGFPACQPYWPQQQRDQAVAACRAFLAQYGNDYQWDGITEIVPFVQPPPRIHFPKLDHPATPEDVKEGPPSFLFPGRRGSFRWLVFPRMPPVQIVRRIRLKAFRIPTAGADKRR